MKTFPRFKSFGVAVLCTFFVAGLAGGALADDLGAALAFPIVSDEHLPIFAGANVETFVTVTNAGPTSIVAKLYFLIDPPYARNVTRQFETAELAIAGNDTATLVFSIDGAGLRVTDMDDPGFTFEVDARDGILFVAAADAATGETLSSNVLLGEFVYVDYGTGSALSAPAHVFSGVANNGDEVFEFNDVEYLAQPSSVGGGFMIPDGVAKETALILYSLDGTIGSNSPRVEIAGTASDADDQEIFQFDYSFDGFAVENLGNIDPEFLTADFGGDPEGMLELVPQPVTWPVLPNAHDRLFGNGDGTRRRPVLGWIVEAVINGGITAEADSLDFAPTSIVPEAGDQPPVLNADAVDDPVLYVGVWSAPKIYRYRIAPDGKVRAQLGTALDAPGDARDMLVTPDQKYLYYGSTDLNTYEIMNAKGKLKLHNTAPIGSGAFDDLALHGDRLYGTHSKGTGRLFVFDVSEGAPVNMGRCDDDNAPCASTTDCATGTCVGRCDDPTQSACTSNGECAGACIPLDFTALPIQEATTPLDPHGVAVRPDGQFVFVANGFNFVVSPPETHEISSFPVNGDGTVVDGGAGYSVTTSYPCADYLAIAEDPSTPGAAFLYHTERPGMDDAVSQKVDAATGQVTTEDAEFAGGGSTQLRLDPDGVGLYVVNMLDDTVSAFLVDGAELTKIDDYPTGMAPKHLISHGDFLYVANAGDLFNPSTISVFSIAPDGTLDPIQTKTIDNGSGLDQGAYRLEIFDSSWSDGFTTLELRVGKSAGAPDEVELSWSDEAAFYDIYQATDCPNLLEYHLDTTTETSYTHAGTSTGLSCYCVMVSP